MEVDRYKVDVLRFKNPHLIWVLVNKEGDEDTIFFEQIGIYGILPQNLTFRGLDCVLNAEHCDQWMPAASVTMERCFREAEEVWFSPTYIHETSSLFDNNTHKYGDIMVVKKNGDIVNLLEEIVHSEFGYKDESLFHQQLIGNNLNTQLNYIERYEVMKNIEEAYKTRDIPKMTWLNVFIKQTSVYQDSRHLEASIMSRRLAVCDRDDFTDMDTLLNNKVLNVTKLCKDVDEVSIGRACCARTSLTSNKSRSLILEKKLALLESLSIANKPKTSKPEEAIDSENQSNMHADKNTNVINSDVKPNDEAFEERQNNNTLSPEHKNHLTGFDKNDNIAPVLQLCQELREPVGKNTNLVAYGPAGLSINKFTVKPLPAQEEPVKVEKSNPEPEPEIEVKNEDVHTNTDSEVNLKMSIYPNLEIRSINSNLNHSITSKLKDNVEALIAIKDKMKCLEEKQLCINVSLSLVSDTERNEEDASVIGLEENSNFT